MMSHRLQRLIYIPFMLPSIVIGAFVMEKNQLPPVVCLLNMICLLALSLLALLPSERMGERIVQSVKGRYLYGIVFGAIAILLLPFFDRGLEGVHRWISLGGLRLHGAMIVLPLLIPALFHLAREKEKQMIAWAAALLVLVLLLVQPDASQVTGAGAAFAVMVGSTKTDRKKKGIMLALVIAAVIFSWFDLDALAPVAHVEGIMRLAFKESVLLLLIGGVSLCFVPLPFFLFPKKNAKMLSVSMGVYYVGIIVSAFLSNFPVPLMGYGVSPVIGIFLSFLWLGVWRKRHFICSHGG